MESSSRSKVRYTPLDGASSAASPASLRTYLICGLLVVVTAGASFFAGRYSAGTGPDSPIPLATVSKPFVYNRTFASAPSPASDRAWAALFPAHGGFFTRPPLAPERSVFSAFHQLHCLNGLRKAVYAGRPGKDAPSDVERRTDEDMETSPAHVRHCIDLLRQSLMCAPDLTVETKDPARGGVTGFGTTHRCRDWTQLVAWVARWEEVGAPESGSTRD